MIEIDIWESDQVMAMSVKKNPLEKLLLNDLVELICSTNDNLIITNLNEYCLISACNEINKWMSNWMKNWKWNAFLLVQYPMIGWENGIITQKYDILKKCLEKVWIKFKKKSIEKKFFQILI